MSGLTGAPVPTELTYDLTHSTPDAIRDDLADARFQLRMVRGLYAACFDTLCEAGQELERQRRQIADLRDELRRFTAAAAKTMTDSTKPLTVKTVSDVDAL